MDRDTLADALENAAPTVSVGIAALGLPAALAPIVAALFKLGAMVLRSGGDASHIERLIELGPLLDSGRIEADKLEEEKFKRGND